MRLGTELQTKDDLVDHSEEKDLSPRVQWFLPPQYYLEKLEHLEFLWHRHLEAEGHSGLKSGLQVTPFFSSGEWKWPLLTPRALAAGISMALAASTSSLGCYALCGQLLHLSPPPPHACSRGLSLEGLGSVVAGLLGSPLGTASSFPNVGTVSLFQVCGLETGPGN